MRNSNVPSNCRSFSLSLALFRCAIVSLSTSVVDVNPQLLILNNWGSTYLDSHKGLGAYSEKELGVYKKKNWGYLRIGGIYKK